MTAGHTAGRAAIGAISPARRAAILGGVVAVALLGWLAWGWFRDSPLVKVRHVQVSGVAGHDAAQVRRALTSAGLGMTTLHVRSDDLRKAVSPYATVRSLSVSTGFPSTLRIKVDQRDAVAVVANGQRRLAVAADGRALPGTDTARLPTLPAGGIPKDGRLAGPNRVLAMVVGGAPAVLRPMLERVWQAKEGVRIAVRNGPEIQFGSPLRIHAKWAAATRLLGARSTVGAKTIDVRLPERPAANFRDPVVAAAPAVTQPAPAATAATTTATPATTTTSTGTNPQP